MGTLYIHTCTAGIGEGEMGLFRPQESEWNVAGRKQCILFPGKVQCGNGFQLAFSLALLTGAWPAHVATKTVGLTPFLLHQSAIDDNVCTFVYRGQSNELNIEQVHI